MLVTRIFRIQEWLVVKLLFNLAIAFAYILSTGISPADVLPISLLVVLYIISVGSFGYYCNDMFDANGNLCRTYCYKRIRVKNIISVFVLITLVSLSFVPYLYALSEPNLYFILLAIHLVLLLSYPIPVLRIKSSVLGLIWDALYSYVFPATVTLSICSGYHGVSLQFDIVTGFLVTAWLFFAGLRSILSHQLSDYDNDICTGTTTFTVRHGQTLSRRLTTAATIAEWLLFVAVAVVVIDSLLIPIIASIIMFLVVEIGFRFRSFRRQTKINTAIALTNQLYDYYLFAGFFVWASVHWNLAAAVYPVTFLMIRLNAFSWCYHHIVLWVFHKLNGGFKRLRKLFKS
ncbi:MAG TPA: hypothetical protein PLK75_02940 [Bacteroidales bacterium]|nr:hypothetical protein [Bacteroidales bacterium]